MIEKSEKCTVCGACKSICPKNAIIFQEDSIGARSPFVDNTICIDCGLCEKVCPIDKNFDFLSVNKVYAAFSNHCEIYDKSASGGIASEIYAFALKNGYFSMGTFFDRKVGVYFKEIKTYEDLQWACNSKYVFSDAFDIFEKYYEKLRYGKSCIFIGLPCQCAGLKNYINLKNFHLLEKLFLIDIVCHGVPTWKFLNQHLTRIENKKKSITKTMSFRNKQGYIIQCFDDFENEFYCKSMHKAEVYGKAFLNSLIFRNNCYQCFYAKKERITDLTLGDFDGLGSELPYNRTVDIVSCVLVFTEKGKSLLNMISNNLTIEERPVNEVFKFNYQLNFPSIMHKNRKSFIKRYIKTQNFDKAVKYSLFKELYFDFNPKFFLILFLKKHFNGLYLFLKKIGNKYVK